MGIKNICLLAWFLQVFTVFAGQPDSLCCRREVRLNGAYFKSYFADVRDVAGAPIRWDRREWLSVTALAGITLVVYTQDDALRDLFQRNRWHVAEQSSRYFFEPLGRGEVIFPMMGGVTIAGLATGNQRLSRAGLTAVKAMAVTALFTHAIKYAAQRYRPHEYDPPNPRIWEGPFGTYTHTSFPSGHSSVVFAAAAVFAGEYRDKPWVPVLAYTLASLSALSRIYDDEHWATDVIIGSALGFGIGKLVYRNTACSPKLTALPGVSVSGQPGFTMIYHLR
jgi:membrane-associated phospholipid phosphatase